MYLATIRARNRDMRNRARKDLIKMRQMMTDGPIEVGTIPSSNGGHNVIVRRYEITEATWIDNSCQMRMKRECEFSIGPAVFTLYLTQNINMPMLFKIGDDVTGTTRPSSIMRVATDEQFNNMLFVNRLFYPRGRENASNTVRIIENGRERVYIKLAVSMNEPRDRQKYRMNEQWSFETLLKDASFSQADIERPTAKFLQDQSSELRHRKYLADRAAAIAADDAKNASGKPKFAVTSTRTGERYTCASFAAVGRYVNRVTHGCFTDYMIKKSIATGLILCHVRVEKL
jgi:hypothetical protein